MKDDALLKKIKKAVDKEQRKVHLAELLIYPFVQQSLGYLYTNWMSLRVLSLIGECSVNIASIIPGLNEAGKKDVRSHGDCGK